MTRLEDFVLLFLKIQNSLQESKRDEIKNFVSKILTDFTNRCILWVFFPEWGMREKGDVGASLKLHNYICSVGSSWGSKRTFLKGAGKVGNFHYTFHNTCLFLLLFYREGGGFGPHPVVGA